MLRLYGSLVALALIATGAVAQTVPETEPNNTPGQANRATLGGKATGTLRYVDGTGSSAGDDAADWWKLDATAGQMIFAKVDADEYGSALDSRLTLYGPDGSTQLASVDNWDGLDPYLAYQAPSSGTYYLAISTGPGPSSAQPYTINFVETKCPVSSEEREPNDNPGQAVPIAMGQIIHAYSCPYGDAGGGVTNPDYYRIDVPAGARLAVQMDTVGRPKPAFGCGCEIEPRLALLASDGTTTLAQTTQFDYPKRIEYTATNGGTYYIFASIWPGGIKYPYTLRVNGTSSSANGDPTVVRASGLGNPWAVISDPQGDFIVADESGNQVWWVAPDGRKQVITRDVQAPSALAWDAFANLLIVGRAGVYKLDPKGNVSSFIAGEAFHGVALGTDGTLWLTSTNPPSLRHYDGFGNALESIPVTLGAEESGPYEIAVASWGDLFYATDRVNTPEGSSVYHVVNSQSQRVLQTDFDITGLALDASGNFYMTSRAHNEVVRYTFNGDPLDNPLASQVSQPTGIAFGRNNDGSMNSKVFVVENGNGRLMQLNEPSVDKNGAPVGFATSPQAITDLLKPGALTDAQRRVLDQLGNKNGRYDIGDLRAFLINTQTVSP